jgi:uncharacterized protein DUF5317
MFVEILIFSVVIGYILKGRLKNLENVNVSNVYIIFVAFSIEVLVIFLIRTGILKRGSVTYMLDLIMYILLVVFTMKNRKNHFLLLMGIGFLLNAIPIFLNGGAMPVSSEAVKAAGLTENVTKEGLYTLINENTRMWFLGDVIPLTFLRNFAISIGDIVAGIGLMLFVITGMRAKHKSIKA